MRRTTAASVGSMIQVAVLDRDDSLGNVTEHMKQIVAKQGIPYHTKIVRKAVDAALAGRIRARQKFAKVKAEALARPWPQSQRRIRH
jgi:hypothetical protein